MNGTLTSPTGSPIVGTLERLSGTAVVGHWRREPDGALNPEYAGETKIWWEEQRTVEVEGQLVVIDEDGEEWAASACTFAAISEEHNG